jgi:hypothetical protein
LGTEVILEQRIVGIKGQVVCAVTRGIPGHEAACEGGAVCRYYGIPFQIREGVSGLVQGRGETPKLSAHVWAQFPSSLFGRVLEWCTTNVLNVVERDREHARRELEYLKRAIAGAD